MAGQQTFLDFRNAEVKKQLESSNQKVFDLTTRVREQEQQLSNADLRIRNAGKIIFVDLVTQQQKTKCSSKWNPQTGSPMSLYQTSFYAETHVEPLLTKCFATAEESQRTAMKESKRVEDELRSTIRFLKSEQTGKTARIGELCEIVTSRESTIETEVEEQNKMKTRIDQLEGELAVSGIRLEKSLEASRSSSSELAVMAKAVEDLEAHLREKDSIAAQLSDMVNTLVERLKDKDATIKELAQKATRSDKKRQEDPVEVITKHFKIAIDNGK
eukprot:gene25704-31435_t